MKRKFIVGLIGVLLLAPVGARVLGGQGAANAPGAQPHRPPGGPVAPEGLAAPGAAMVFIGDGGIWLGVRLRDITTENARELKLPGEYGALVLEVEPDSPAAKAGLEKNDVMLEFGGERVRSVA